MNVPRTITESPWRWLPFVLITLVYALELNVDVMEVDSAQYAHIAEEMFRTKSFLIIHNRGADYLDKPPVTFWLASLSFAVFGVSTWAYKLPSLLAALVAIFSTYRLTRLVQSERIAYLAALMLASTLATFMWTNDVRTDTVLLGAVMFATWQLTSHLVSGSGSSFWVGWIGIGAALLAKGPIGAFVPLVAVGAQALWQRNWRWLVHPRWLGGGVLALLVLSPMLAGLSAQYGWRGITFFFWTQSFGRITGESSWKDSTTPLFFVHTVLWELLPWTLFFVIGLARDTWDLGRRRLAPEVLSLAGFVVPFVALSLSHYKLPHYIFVTIPFACVIAAKQIERSSTAWSLVQWIAVAALWTLVLGLTISVFPLKFGALAVILGAALLMTLYWCLPRHEQLNRLLLPSLFSQLALAAVLATHFYPQLLTYQAPSVAAHMLKARQVPPDRVRTYGPASYALDFELRTNVQRLDQSELTARRDDLWIFTDEAGRHALAEATVPVEEIAVLPDYPVSRWSLAFFNPATRESRLQRRFLVRLPSRQ